MCIDMDQDEDDDGMYTKQASNQRNRVYIHTDIHIYLHASANLAATKWSRPPGGAIKKALFLEPG